jgi:hypothetical protein
MLVEKRKVSTQSSKASISPTWKVKSKMNSKQVRTEARDTEA